MARPTDPAPATGWVIRLTSALTPESILQPRPETGGQPVHMVSTTPGAVSDRFALHRDPHPARVATFAEDVRASLGTRPLRVSPKYFYDDLGSALFEAITRLPEYYLTRVERDLLATYGREIVAALDGPLELVELGSGSAIKTRLLIDAILERQRALTFHPVDISAAAVTESSLALAAAYERLRVVAYASDYF